MPVVFLDLGAQSVGYGVILRRSQTLVGNIGHLPDKLLGDGAVMRYHAVDPFSVHIAVQLLDGGIQPRAEALGLQAAAEQGVAPVVADAPFPAVGFAVIIEGILGMAQHTVIVPIENVPCLGVQRAVQIAVAVLGVHIAGQQLERHPVGNVFCIKIAAEDFLHGDGIVIQYLQHFEKLRVVAAALGLKALLKFLLVIVRVSGQLEVILIALKFKGVHLVQLSVPVKAMRFQRRLVQLLNLSIQPVILKGGPAARGQIPDI